MPDTIAARLHAAIQATCPIVGVSIGAPATKATWRIDFASEATAQQRADAAAALAAFDPTEPAPVPRPTIDDIVAVLPAALQAALAARIAARR